MGEPKPRWQTTVEKEGVTLQKFSGKHQNNVPSVDFELTSDRDSPAEVRIIETIPDNLDPEDLGFLTSETGEQIWEIHVPKLVYERSIDPGESFKTAIAVRGGSVKTLESLFDTPDEFTITAQSDVTGSGTPDSDKEISDPDNGGSRVFEDVETPREKNSRVVDSFVEELQAGKVEPDQLDILRKHLAGPNHRGSMETRIKQLQADVADVRAYTNAMEGLLDEFGTPQDIIDQFQQRIDRLESKFEAGHKTEQKYATVRQDVDAIEDRIETIEDSLDTLESDFKGLESRIEEIEEVLPEDDLDDQLNQISEELNELSEFMSSLKKAVDHSKNT